MKINNGVSVNTDRIKELAKLQGKSLKYLCDKLKKRGSFISEVKHGKDRIDNHELQIIADELNTTVEYLTDQTDQKEKPVDQMTDEQLDNALIHLLSGLTADDIKKVEAFIAGLKAGKE